MRRGQNHLRLEPDLRRDLFRECTHGSLRHGNRAEHLLRDAEHIHQLVVPILRLCTHELRRCRIRVLVLHDPRQEIVQIVGNHQKMFCRRQGLGTFLPDRHKLIDRVEDLLLNPVACVERLLRNRPVDQRIHALRPPIPIGNSIAEQLSGPIEQDKIHRPGVNPDALRNPIQRAAPLQPLDHLVKEMIHIPAEMPVPSHETVLKAMNLLDTDLPVLNPAQNVTPARCTNINRQIIRMLHRLFPPISCLSVLLSLCCFIFVFYIIKHNLS